MEDVDVGGKGFISESGVGLLSDRRGSALDDGGSEVLGDVLGVVRWRYRRGRPVDFSFLEDDVPGLDDRLRRPVVQLVGVSPEIANHGVFD